MKRYTFAIKLTNGNEIQARSVANTSHEAIDKIMLTEQAKDFIGNSSVEAINLVSEEPIAVLPQERYVLQPSDDLGWWVVTDKDRGIVCKFRSKQFNKTQQFTDLNDEPITDALTLAAVMREFGEWLALYHKDIIL